MRLGDSPSRDVMSGVTPPPGAGGASPGLLRRRYSVPETIMRKYRLAQLRSDSDDSEPATAPSPAPSDPPQSHARRQGDRELMRKSAMLRRLWDTAAPHTGSSGDLPPCVSCCCERQLYDSHAEYEREFRSLDSSRAELRQSPASYATEASHPPLGWATPKRQRLDSPVRLTGSDEMLRTAVRNSYNRERQRCDIPSPASTYHSYEHEQSFGEVSRLSALPHPVDDQRRKKRPSVCIYINSLDSPSAEIRSATVTDSTESSVPRSQPTTSNSTFLTSDTSSSQVYTEISTGLDSAETNDAHSNTESYSAKSEEEHTCIAGANNVTDINNKNIYTKASKLTESTVEILEIVVSETLNSSAFSDREYPADIENVNSKNPTKVSDITKHPPRKFQPVDLDQYVSNILVESLNSLSDQIEVMNASIDTDHKISIVEKEIKVKLQNTGINTIVHLSPTSDNQIIFGNEELYEKHEINELKGMCFEDQSTRERDTIEIELTDNNDFRRTENSANVTQVSSKEFDNENELLASMINNDNVNQSVLEQIQKLFHEGLDLDPVMQYPGRMVPEISHIEISNVDVYIDDNSDPNIKYNDRIEIKTDRNSCRFDGNLSNLTDLGEVGTGTYYKEPTGPVLVPRFTAFPNTESMEVNTSSSEDADVLGSDCTSLVDSLDDPSSPRNILLRRARRTNRRSELVRSAIDVLDLLPEMSHSESRAREKSEAFFIRIRDDDDCDCEKENVIVADHMPDKIRQRLYRRHRKRELRMEYAKRKKVRQIKRDIEKQRSTETVKSRKEIENDCTVILQSLIDEVLAKIVEEEHKCMRIKQSSKSTKKILDKESVPRKPIINSKSEDTGKLESLKVQKNGDVHFPNDIIGNTNCKMIGRHENYKSTQKTPNRKKQPQYPRAPAPPGDRGPKRFYQKSEIHDGNKCIEILEIIEYADNSTLSSSPDTQSDEKDKNKPRKSRIPIPIYEQIHKFPKFKNSQSLYKGLVQSSPNLKYEKHPDHSYNVDSLITDTIINSFNDNVTSTRVKSERTPNRRASVPQQEQVKSRSSNTLRFKQMFDIIPEEKSSMSVESSNEDINLNRRVSVPILGNTRESNNNRSPKYEKQNKSKDTMSSKLSKSTSTSPSPPENNKPRIKHLKTVATSPIAPPKHEQNIKNGNVKQKSGSKKSLSSLGTKEGWLGFYEPQRQLLEEEGIIRLRRAHIH